MAIRFLLNADGANGSTPATDDSGRALTWYGSAALDTSTFPTGFGTACATFTGDGGVRAANVTTTASGQFTLAFWFNLPNLPGVGEVFTLVNVYHVSGNGTFSVSVDEFGLNYQIGNTYTNLGGQLTVGTGWTYFTLSYETASEFIYVSLNGNMVSWQAIGVTPAPLTTTVSIGENVDYGQYLIGSIDGVMIDDTDVLYTTNFTPPTAPFVYSGPAPQTHNVAGTAAATASNTAGGTQSTAAAGSASATAANANDATTSGATLPVPKGMYDQTVVPKGWFHDPATPKAWFAVELLDEEGGVVTHSASGAEAVTADTVGTGTGVMFAARAETATSDGVQAGTFSTTVARTESATAAETNTASQAQPAAHVASTAATDAHDYSWVGGSNVYNEAHTATVTASETGVAVALAAAIHTASAPATDIPVATAQFVAQHTASSTSDTTQTAAGLVPVGNTSAATAGDAPAGTLATATAGSAVGTGTDTPASTFTASAAGSAVGAGTDTPASTYTTSASDTAAVTASSAQTGGALVPVAKTEVATGADASVPSLATASIITETAPADSEQDALSSAIQSVTEPAPATSAQVVQADFVATHTASTALTDAPVGIYATSSSSTETSPADTTIDSTALKLHVTDRSEATAALAAQAALSVQVVQDTAQAVAATEQATDGLTVTDTTEVAPATAAQAATQVFTSTITQAGVAVASAVGTLFAAATAIDAASATAVATYTINTTSSQDEPVSLQDIINGAYTGTVASAESATASAAQLGGLVTLATISNASSAAAAQDALRQQLADGQAATSASSSHVALGSLTATIAESVFSIDIAGVSALFVVSTAEALAPTDSSDSSLQIGAAAEELAAAIETLLAELFGKLGKNNDYTRVLLEVARTMVLADKATLRIMVEGKSVTVQPDKATDVVVSMTPVTVFKSDKL